MLMCMVASVVQLIVAVRRVETGGQSADSVDCGVVRLGEIWSFSC